MSAAPEIDENEAIDTIARLVAPHTDKLTVGATRIEQCSLIYEAIHGGRISLEDAAAAAINGDPYVDRALRRVARDYLPDIPEALLPFINYVLGAEGPANFSRGDTSLSFWSRNIAIKVLVEEAKRRWGLNDTRNEATISAPSACSIVSAALGRCGIEISEKRLEEINRKMRSRPTKKY